MLPMLGTVCAGQLPAVPQRALHVLTPHAMCSQLMLCCNSAVSVHFNSQKKAEKGRKMAARATSRQMAQPTTRGR